MVDRAAAAFCLLVFLPLNLHWMARLTREEAPAPVWVAPPLGWGLAFLLKTALRL